MNTKNFLLVVGIVVFLASCAFMPNGKCPVTAKVFLENASDGSIEITIALKDGDFITPNPVTIHPGMIAEGELEVGIYEIIVWDMKEGSSAPSWKYETSIRCKSKSWTYSNNHLFTSRDYIGGKTHDILLMPNIL